MEGAADGSAGDVARLEARRGEDAGAAAFPALAEAHRRAGDAKRAAQVAREGLARDPESPAGRVALALALLDSGALEGARAELEGVLESVADHPRARAALGAAGGAPPAPAPAPAGESGEGLSGIAEDEVESAFEGAEARSDEMVDANHLAEAALRSVEGEASEPAPAAEAGAPGAAEAGADAPGATRSPFATQTMAGLLERQGYGEEARRLRASLEERAPAPPPTGGADEAPETRSAATRRARALAVLERWLAYLRRAPR